MPNEFHSDIPAKAIANVQACLDAVRAAPTTGLIFLTPTERKTMLRTANNSVAFVTKTTDYATVRHGFMPASVNLAGLQQHATSTAASTPLRQPLEQLAPDTDSPAIITGSDACGNALIGDSNSKFLTKTPAARGPTRLPHPKDPLRRQPRGRPQAKPRQTLSGSDFVGPSFD